MNDTDNPAPTANDRPGRLHGERIRAMTEQIATAAGIPAISVAVATPERILYAGAVGHADLAQHRAATPDDQYAWFSMTKIATATAAMRLHADGALDLDAPVGSYLTGYRPHPEHGQPTTRQLLSHTAGLRNPLPVRWVRPEDETPDPTRLARVLDKHGTPRRPVGAAAAYSNIGYLLAAEVMQAATGRPVEQCVRETVLEPLGMTGTGYRYRHGAPRAVGYVGMPRVFRPLLSRLLPDGIVGPRVGRYTSFHPFLVSGAGYGGLIGPVTDAVRLAAAHPAAAADPHPVLGQPDIERMRTISATGKPFDHGIGWFRRPADADRTPRFVEHYGTGGGFWNAMRIYPQDRLAMVAMANTTARWDVDRLFTALRGLPWS
jgi:CubicO group peptidase (beta-lactamase class C family)